MWLSEQHSNFEFFVKLAKRKYKDRMPGQDDMGYGKKMMTDLMVKVNGKNHRVFCTCYSNSASFWIKINENSFHIKDGDIPDNIRREWQCAR
jgi:poly(3-hydroxybutyrate) depolymerase